MGKDTKAPKSALDKVVVVVKAAMTPGGSTRPAIVKALKEQFGEVGAPQLKTALKKGVEGGVLVQGQGQRWWVAGHEPPPPPPEETVDIVEVKEGTGDTATAGTSCTMSYVGTLKEGGEQFDAAKKFTFTLGGGEVIKGWEVGVKGMRVGGARCLTVPAKLGYGKRGSPPEIPPNAALVFDIKLLAVK